MSTESKEAENSAVDLAILAWFEAAKSGTPPSRTEFLKRFPEIGSELNRFFEDYDCFRRRVPEFEVGSSNPSNQPLEQQQTVLNVGDTVDSVLTNSRYRELAEIKKGGLGTLYRAYDETLHRETAVKFLQDKCTGDPGLLKQFRVEAEITGRLDHPGVVPVYGIGEDWNGRPFYVMRLVKGRELSLVIQDYHSARSAHPNSADTRRQLLTLLEHLVSACNTVAYAHDVGIIHCDVKPANIMVGKYGEAFVLDWGLAITYERTTTFYATQTAVRPRSVEDPSSSGQRGGTIGYISPEQLSQEEPISPTSDVYSLGATLYEILTGVPPFNGRDRNVIERIRKGDFPAPRSVLKAVPHRLEAICLKAMSLHPRARYGTAKLLASDLVNWMRDDELLVLPDRWYHRVRRVARRHRAITATSTIAAIVVAATLTWTMYQTQRHRYLEEQNKLVQQQNEFMQRQNELVQKSLNTSLETFEDLCQPLTKGEMNNLAAFRPFADRINQFTSEYLEEFEKNLLMLPHTARVYELRATVSRVLSSDTDKALRYYRQAEEIYRTQYQNTKDQSTANELQRRLAHLQLNVGWLYIQRDEYDDAEKVLIDVREVLESLQKRQRDDVDLNRNLAEVFHSLGQVNLEREVDGAARHQSLLLSQEFFEKSADLRTDLVEQTKGADQRNHQRDLARSYGYLGDLYSAQGFIVKAEQSYTESKELRHTLYRSNPTDPEYRFQFARGLGNFGSLERNYEGNLTHAIETLTQAEKLQEGLVHEFPEVKAFRRDLAGTQNSLAEVYLWLATNQPDQRAEYLKLSREFAESASTNYGQNLSLKGHQLDLQSANGLAFSRVTRAAIEQLEGGGNTAALAKEATALLLNRPGGEFVLGRGELVTFALAASLQGDAKSAFTALKNAVARGDNTVVRFEKHAQAGFKTLATDATYGPQFRDLCGEVREGLK